MNEWRDLKTDGQTDGGIDGFFTIIDNWNLTHNRQLYFYIYLYIIN